MTKYDDLFDDTAPTESVFRDKGALDPLTPPEEIIARAEQERQLARILNGVHEGYLPTTVSIYGPPGTGKTMTTRRVCEEFVARTDFVAVEYVNLKECRTIFSAANEILFELTGEKAGAYVGLDGVFTAIWEAPVEYPEWTICILDEVDQLRHDSNYDHSEFRVQNIVERCVRRRFFQLTSLFYHDLQETPTQAAECVQNECHVTYFGYSEKICNQSQLRSVWTAGGASRHSDSAAYCPLPGVRAIHPRLQ